MKEYSLTKRLKTGLIIAGVVGILGSSLVCAYFHNKQKVALQNPQRTLFVETENELEKTFEEMNYIQNLNKITFDATGKNIIYSDPEITDRYQMLKQKCLDSRDTYNALICSGVADIIGNERKYGKVKNVGLVLGALSLASLVLGASRKTEATVRIK